MAGSTTWTFAQQGGQKKTLILDGWSAPFGRPRQGAIVEDAIEIRQAEVYYPGNETGPTRHVFGRKYHPREIHGRFRDRARGQGYAAAKVLEVKAFVADQQIVRVTWSDQISELGFLTEFIPGRESEGEVTWKITYACDSDDFKQKIVPQPYQQLPLDFSAAIAANMAAAFPPMLALPEMQGSIFDALDVALTAIEIVAATLSTVAGSVPSFELAPFGTLRRMLSLLGEIRVSLAEIQADFLDVDSGSILLRDNAAANVAAWQAQAAVDLAIQEMLGDCSDMERQARIALIGRPFSLYVVQAGDTWESISTLRYGAPDRAGDLWGANGSAEYPTAGFQITVPA